MDDFSCSTANGYSSLNYQNHQIKNGKTKKQKSKSKEKTSPVPDAQNKNIVELPIKLSGSDSMQTQTTLLEIIDSTKNEKPKNKKSKSKEKTITVPTSQNKIDGELPIEMPSSDSMKINSPVTIEATKNSKPKKQKSKSKEKTNPAPDVQNKNDVENPLQMPSSDSTQFTMPVIVDSTKNSVEKVDQ